MSDIELLMATLRRMRCRFSYSHDQNPKHVLCGEEGPASIAQRVSVAQAHFYFNKRGRFVGALSDETGYWSLPDKFEEINDDAQKR